MLRLALTFLLISLLGSIETASINKRRVDDFEVLEEYFARKCTKNANYAAFMMLELNVRGLIASQSRHGRRTGEDLYNSICNPTFGYERLDSLMTALEPCLDTEEKYLPDFARTTYNDSREDLCKGGKDDFIATIDDLGNTQCEDPKLNFAVVGNSCLVELIDRNFDFNSDTSLTKNLVCGQIEAGRDCLIDGFKSVCTDDVLPNFLMRGFKPYLDWCEKH